MEGGEPLPDDLRCRRTDGRAWRCKRHVFDGKIYCQNHLYRGRVKPPSNPNANPKETPHIRVLVRVKPEPPDGGPERVSGAKEQSQVLENGNDGLSLCEIDLNSTPRSGEKQMETPVPEKEESLVDNVRCSRNDGRAWRCKGRAVEGGALCESHCRKVKVRGEDGVLVVGKLPRKRKKFQPVPENVRCSVIHGRGRCQREVLEGGSLCEAHSKRMEKSPKKKISVMKIKLEPETQVEAEPEPEPEKEKEVLKQIEKEKEGGGTPLMEGEGDDIQCKRTDGRSWRCKMKVLDGKLLCEVHYEQERLRRKRISVPESMKIKRVEGGAEKIEKRVKKKRELEVLESSPSNKGMKRRKEDLIRVFLRRESKNSVEVTKDLPYGLMAIAPALPTRFLDNAESLGIKLGLQRSKPSVTRRIRSKNIEPPPISSLKVVPYVGNLGKVKNNGRNKCHWCRCSETETLTKCLTCKKRFFCSNCMKERCANPEEVKLRCPVCRGSCECKLCRKNTRSKDVVTKGILKEQYTGGKLRQLQYLINYLLPILVKINKVQSTEVEMEAKFKGQSVSNVDIKQAEVGCSDSCCCNNCKSPILDFHRSCPNCSYKLCLSCCQEYTQGGWLMGQTAVKNKMQTRFPALLSCSEKIQKRTATQNTEAEDLPAFHLHTSCHKDGFQVQFLDLRSTFPLNWTNELEMSAREIVSGCDFLQTRDETGECSFCGISGASKSKELQEASRRKGSEDNFLFCPFVSDDHEALLAHFKKHWQKGQPVIVHNVLQDALSLSWNPVAMFYRYLEIATCSENMKEFESANSSDWYEVEIGVTKSFTGLLGKGFPCKRRETLKLKAKLSSALSHKLFESNYSGIIQALPFQEYTNPRTGLLNLSGKLPEDFPNSILGPHLCISFGSREEIVQGKLVTNLCFNSYDAVNVLVHASDSPCSTELVSKIKRIMQNDPKDKEGHCVDNFESDKAHGFDTDSDASMICSGAHNSPEKPAQQILQPDCVETSNLSDERHPMDLRGAQWDIFRRQDIPKLMEYFSKHVDEFIYGCDQPKNVIHPIFDGSFYLDATHKLRLKEEFEIEPWTFIQCLGEVVFIPAGCPYQIRNIKSCVNVVVGFVSPENASECIKLMDEIRVLPNNHNAKQQKLEVEKMTICSVDEAIKEMYKLKGETHSPPVN